MLRRLLLLGVALLAAGIGALAFLADRIELGGFAAARASAALGREVTVGSLRVALAGTWLHVALRDARLANAANGSEPDMVRLARLDAEIRLADLITGAAPTLRAVSVEGASLLLEHGTGPGKDQPNWRFGPPAAPPSGAPDRSGLPLLLDAAIGDAEIVIRTSSGQALRLRVESGRIAAPGAEQPVTLQASGTYNETPLTIDVTGAATRVLRETATPYPVELAATSGDTRLGFKGTMTDPLNADGAAGQVTLAAPTPAVLLALAGAEMTLNGGLELAGAATRQGDLWRLSDATGSFAGSPLRMAAAELREGARGEPDRIAVEASLDRLDLNRVLGSAAVADSDADMPLALDAKQDPLLEAKLAVGTLAYAKLRATGLRLDASLGAGTATVREVALSTGGANVTASLQAAAAAGGGASITAQVALADSDLETMRRTIGLRPLPVSGRVDGRVVVAAGGRMLNQAAHDARVSAVLALRQGSIAQEVIEMASTDLRLLFRAARGTVPMRCLLAVVSMNAGVGEVAPLRIRAETGTITGMASFDLFRGRLDAVVGSQRETTDFWGARRADADLGQLRRSGDPAGALVRRRSGKARRGRAHGAAAGRPARLRAA